MMRLIKTLVALGFLLSVAAPCGAQVFQTGAPAIATSASSITPSRAGVDGDNKVGFALLSIEGSACSTLATTSGWTLLQKSQVNSDLCAAVYTIVFGASNTDPTFTWTGSYTATAVVLNAVSLANSSPVDTSTVNAVTSTNTPVGTGFSTAGPLEYVIAFTFTDFAGGVGFTPSASMATVYDSGLTSYPFFASAFWQKPTGTVPNQTATLNQITNTATIMAAFKPLSAPPVPVFGDVVPGAVTAASLTDTGITGSTQCLHASSSGAISGTGVDCGALFASTTVSVTAPTAVGCTDGTVSVASAATSMAVLASPRSNPNGSSGAVTWSAYVSTAGTVDVRVCNLVVETSPPATTYNVQVYE